MRRASPSRQRWALVVVCGCTAALGYAAENVVVNGNFEKGTGDQPKGWSRIDGLTAFWDKKGGHPGQGLRFDTSVLQVDKKKFLADAESFAGKSKGGQYDTVGAHEGVWAFSAPIEITADDQYFVLEADARAPARSDGLFYPQVFVRGYQRFDPKKHGVGASSFFQAPLEGGPAYSEQFGKDQRPAVAGDYMMVYRHSLVCRLEEANRWQHYALAFKVPKDPRYRPEVLLLKPYAMWPLGEYAFDNIELRRVSKEEYDGVKEKGHSAKGFMPGE